MLDWLNPDAEMRAKRQAEEKRKLFWKHVKFVLGAFFITLLVSLYSNVSDTPWAAVKHMDWQGNVVAVEPDWPVALAISLVLSAAIAGIAFWVCLRGDRHAKT